MEVRPKDKSMEKLLGDTKALIRAYGPQHAKAIQLRIRQLEASPNLEMAHRFPQLKLHALIGDLKGKWGIRLDKNYRMLIIETQCKGCPPAGTSSPRDITSVTITELRTDYH